MIERFKERLPRMRPLLVPLVLYIGLLVAAAFWQAAIPETPWRYLVALAPMLPGLWLAVALMGFIRRLDELSRKVVLESAAAAFAATVLLVVCLGLLGAAGLPAANPAYILLFMGMALFVAKLVISRKYQ